MPIRYTPLINDYYYHIFNRGVNKRPIFKNRWDYKRFVLLLRFYKARDYPIKFSKFMKLSSDQRKEIWTRLSSGISYVDTLAYCLMPNHFHLLIKQRVDHGISKFLANIQNSYARYFNIKNERLGPLYQGQFKAVKIDSEEQLLHVSRYIHLNPYSSAIVKDTEKLLAYEWSSLREYFDQTQFELCSKDEILNSFKDIKGYKEFVLNNAEYQKNLESIKHLTID